MSERDIKRYFVYNHLRKVIRTRQDERQRTGTINIVCKINSQREITEMSEFRLGKFRSFVLPELYNAHNSVMVFAQIGRTLFIYQMGRLSQPELLLDGDMSPKKVVGIHFVCKDFSVKKCGYLLDQLPNLKQITIDILGFGDDADSTDARFEVKTHTFRLSVQTHPWLYQNMTDQEMARMKRKCTDLLKMLGRILSNLKSVNLEFPYSVEIELATTRLLEGNRLLGNNGWMGGGRLNKVMCRFPFKAIQRRPRNPELAALLFAPPSSAGRQSTQQQRAQQQSAHQERTHQQQSAQQQRTQLQPTQQQSTAQPSGRGHQELPPAEGRPEVPSTSTGQGQQSRHAGQAGSNLNKSGNPGPSHKRDTGKK